MRRLVTAAEIEAPDFAAGRHPARFLSWEEVVKRAVKKIKPATIKLGPKDSAFIIRADGSEEIVVPDSKPTARILKSAITIMALATIMHDERLVPLVAERVAERMVKVNAEIEAEKKAKQP